MNVVCHQAVAEQPHAVLPAPLRKCLEIESPVFVAQEDVLTIVAPLGDVVWNALHDHTGHPRHWNVRIIAEFGGCPSFLPFLRPSFLLSFPPHSSFLIPPHSFIPPHSSFSNDNANSLAFRVQFPASPMLCSQPLKRNDCGMQADMDRRCYCRSFRRETRGFWVRWWFAGEGFWDG